jgi:hypothetical protein
MFDITIFFFINPDIVLVYQFPTALRGQAQITNILGIALCVVVKHTKLRGIIVASRKQLL